MPRGWRPRWWSLRRPFPVAGQDLKVGASIGIALAPGTPPTRDPGSSTRTWPCTRPSGKAGAATAAIPNTVRLRLDQACSLAPRVGAHPLPCARLLPGARPSPGCVPCPGGPCAGPCPCRAVMVPIVVAAGGILLKPPGTRPHRSSRSGLGRAGAVPAILPAAQYQPPEKKTSPWYPSTTCTPGATPPGRDGRQSELDAHVNLGLQG